VVYYEGGLEKGEAWKTRKRWGGTLKKKIWKKGDAEKNLLLKNGALNRKHE